MSGRIETDEVEHCTRCGRAIHTFDTPHVHENRVICARCATLLHWRGLLAAAAIIGRRYLQIAFAQSIVRAIAWSAAAWLVGFALALWGIWLLVGIRISGGISGAAWRFLFGAGLLCLAGGLLIMPIYRFFRDDRHHMPPLTAPQQHWLCASCGLRTTRRAKYCSKCGSREIRRD
jgi:hypothetical protein